MNKNPVQPERVRVIELLPHGMGSAGVREFRVQTIGPENCVSPPMWRVIAICHHMNGWEWNAPDTAGYVLITNCLGWTVVVVATNGVLEDVLLVKDNGIERPQHPKRRIDFRKEAFRLLGMSENKGMLKKVSLTRTLVDLMDLSETTTGEGLRRMELLTAD